MNLRELTTAHDHSTANRAEIERSTTCRCFYCLATFSPGEVDEWIDDRDGQTAICPRCGIDSVIGSASGLDLSDGFVRKMCSYWFS
jgi:hypothetical protein